MTGVVVAYIALGANLDNPVQQVRHGIERLSALPATRLVAASSLWRTAPVGGALVAGQPDYINAVAKVETTLAGGDLLRKLQVVERDAGRDRAGQAPMAARRLDLDLLLYGDVRIDTAELTLPHPRMHERAFVLAPLCEVAPGIELPPHGQAADLLARINDQAIERLPRFLS